MPTPKVIKPATKPSLKEVILKLSNWFDESRSLDKIPYPPHNRERKRIRVSVITPGFDYFNLELKAPALITSSDNEEGEQEHRLSITMDRSAALTHSETFPADVPGKWRKALGKHVERMMIQSLLADEKTIQSPGG